MNNSPIRDSFFRRQLLAFVVSFGVTLTVGGHSIAFADSSLPESVANDFVTHGDATYTRDEAARLGVVNQTTDKAILNWKSFNVGAGNTMRFDQPSSTAVAVNKVYQTDASQILGNLQANGQIYLINPNGVVFGDGARVNTGAFVVSTLGIQDEVIKESGLLERIEQDENTAQAVFVAGDGLERFAQVAGEELPADLGVIAIANGAEIASDSEGFVLIIGSAVKNEGTIITPNGQTLMVAADEKVYLSKPGDFESVGLVGMLVEVDLADLPEDVRNAFNNKHGIDQGQVINRGEITAERGNVTLMGMAVNQEGVIRATTAVDVGGSIRLIAREGVDGTVVTVNNRNMALPSNTGAVTIGGNSITEVMPDMGDLEHTMVDATAQKVSRVEIMGKTVEFEEGARVAARSGEIEVTAVDGLSRANVGYLLRNSELRGDIPQADAFVKIGADVEFDVSGLTPEDWAGWIARHPEDQSKSNPLVFSVLRNIKTLKALGYELRDSVLQRNGVLNGAELVFDERNLPSGLLDVSAPVENQGRTVAERSTAGGTIRIKSAGSIEVDDSAHFDISGGHIRYTGGYVNTTKLRAGSQLVDIADADPEIVYDEVLNAGDPGYDDQLSDNFEQGYLEGKDAGTLSFAAKDPDSVLAGTVVGSTTVGRYQRQPASESTDGRLGYDVAPQGGELIIERVKQLYLAADSAGNPTFFSNASLAGPSLKAIGVNRMDVKTDELFVRPDTPTLNLPASGSYSFSAPVVRVEGSIYSPSSELSFLGGSAHLGPGSTGLIVDGTGSLVVDTEVTLDVSGAYINDLGRSVTEWSVTHIDAGTIKLRSHGDLELRSGSRLRANAGAWSANDGGFSAGKGGVIDIAVDYVAAGPKRLVLGGMFEAFVFGGDYGSVLNLTAPGFLIEAANDSPHGQLQGAQNVVVLGDGLFGAGGFTEIGLNSTYSGIDIEAGAVLQLRPKIMRLSDPSVIAQGTDLTSVADFSVGDSNLSPATRIRLTHTSDSDAIYGGAIITIGAGSRLVTSVSRTVDLSGCWSGSVLCSGIRVDTDTAMYIGGELIAKSGDIALNILTNSDSSVSQQFVEDQSIWLGATAKLDVSAGARVTPLGQYVSGDLYDAGTVNIAASRGFVIAENGAQIYMQGGSSYIDLPGGDAEAVMRREGALEYAAAGELHVSSPEGILFFADVHGGVSSGNPNSAGSIHITIDPNERANTEDLVFPEVPVEIRVSETNWSDVGLNVPMGDIPSAYWGKVLLNRTTLASSNVDSLSLTASPHKGYPGHGAAILFEGDVQLQLVGDLILDAPVLSSDGGNVLLQASYVALGAANDTFVVEGADRPIATAGSGSLQVEASMLELVGDLALQGFGGGGSGMNAPVILSAKNDIRYRGVRWKEVGNSLDPTNAEYAKSFRGRLDAASSVTLKSEKGAIYPATLTDYEINLSSGTLSFLGGDGRMPQRHSAAGKLTATADHIVQAAPLIAPFGVIELVGRDSIRLVDGSYTSVSGEGLSMQFGHTEEDGAWLFDFGNVARIIDAPPVKRIDLTAPSIQIEEGATININGGGELIASRFVEGPGGSKDILDNVYADGAFALIPLAEGESAPWDPLASDDFPYALGSVFELPDAEGSPIPGGRYAIMPPEYALQPGAYLVTPTSEKQTLAPGQSYTGDNQIPIVLGRLVDNAGAKDNQWLAYRIENGQQVRARAEYVESSIDDFFVARADAQGTAIPELLNDSGTLVLNATNQLALDGELLNNDTDGLAPRVDIVGPVTVVDSIDTAPATLTGVVLDVHALTNFGADSLLLGGRRRLEGGVTYIDVEADRVSFLDTKPNDGNALILALPEVLMVAHDQVNLGNGVIIESVAGGLDNARPVLIALDDSDMGSDAALLGVSRRELGGFTGFDVGFVADGRITSTGSFGVIAGDRVDFTGSLDAVTGKRVFLGAKRMAVGSGAGALVGQAMVLNPDLLAQFEGNDVQLWAESLEFYGIANIKAENLVVDAGGILGDLDGAASGTVISIDVQGNASFQNVRGIELPDDPAGGLAALQLDASAITFGQGPFVVKGFDVVRLDAGSVVGAGDADVDGLSVTGDLSVMADVVSTVTGGSLSLDATGKVQLKDSVAHEATMDLSDAIGGDVHIEGQSVEIGTRFYLPSGQLTVVANGNAMGSDVLLNAGASIEVNGRIVEFDNLDIGTSGGYLDLIANHGDVHLMGASIDVSGVADGGRAGSINIEAAEGEFTYSGTTLAGSASAGIQQGEFDIDVGSLTGSLSSLNTLLNAGGFNERRHIRVRTGDLKVGAGDQVIAHDVKLVADQGLVEIGGTVDARAEKGATVQLYGQRVLINSAGSILANSSGSSEAGGRVLLEVNDDAGELRVDGSIEVHGGTGAEDTGLVRLTVPVGASYDMSALKSVNVASIAGAKRVELVGTMVYDADSFSGDVVQTINARNALSAMSDFMDSANVNSIAQNLGVNGVSQVHFMPGLTVKGDKLRVSGDLDLFDWDYGNEVGILRLQSAGDILLGSAAGTSVIGDGFTSYGGYDALWNTDSWHMQFIAGSDASSADYTAVVDSGDVIVRDNTSVRTGTGDLEFFAGGDLNLEGTGSVIYTAGIDMGAGRITEAELAAGLITSDVHTYDSGFLARHLSGTVFADKGGAIRIGVGGDLLGPMDADGDPLTEQTPNHWMTRIASIINNRQLGSLPTFWGVDPSRFQQNIGALGGGDIDVRVAGDVTHVYFNIPTSGQQMGDFEFVRRGGGQGTYDPELNTNEVVVLGGGDLDLFVRGTILGGGWYVEDGALRVEALDSIGSDERDAQRVVVALGDTQVSLDAGSDLLIDAIYNPSFVAQTAEQWTGRDPALSGISRFVTYGDNTGLDASALTGNVEFANAADQRIFSLDGFRYDTDSASQRLSTGLYPADVSVTAFSGDIHFAGETYLASSPLSSLTMLANGDISSEFGSALIYQLDVSASVLPSWDTPWVGMLSEYSAIFDDDYPQHAVVPIHIADLSPNYVVSREGDIASMEFLLAKQSRLIAGRDIRDIKAHVQHSLDSSLGTDFTLIQAGRDIVYLTARSSLSGKASTSTILTKGVRVSGGGSVQMIAGRHLNLGQSAGVVTSGNNTNPALPDGGADISLFAGLAESPDYSAFIDRYLLDADALHVRYRVTLDSAASDFTQAELDRLRALFAGTGYWVVGTYLGGNSIGVQIEGEQQGLVTGRPEFTSRLESFASELSAGVTVEANDYQSLAQTYLEEKLRTSYADAGDAVAYLQAAQDQREHLGFYADILFAELVAGGQRAALESDSAQFARSKLAITTLFPSAPTTDSPEAQRDPSTGLITRSSITAVLSSSAYRGDMVSTYSRVSPEDGGSVKVLIPGGQYQGGSINETDADTGIVVPKGGDVMVMAASDIVVNGSKIINLSSGGDMVLWSSLANIDAGRGARGALVQAERFALNSILGNRIPNDSPDVAGSGIQNVPSGDGVVGNTYLLTEGGVVDAGTAGIQSPNITIVAQQVANTEALDLGNVTSNLSIGNGDSAPASTPSVGDSSAADAASQAASDSTSDLADTKARNDDEQLAMLSVDVVGFGVEELPATGAGETNCEDPRNRALPRCRRTADSL